MDSALVADSQKGLSWMESAAMGSIRLDAAQAEVLRAAVEAHPDASSYHRLGVLRREQPAIYARIAPETRARVLCAALATSRYLNDWGYLDPGESYDGKAATALLETGRAALSCLAPLLDDLGAAPLFGSEEATMSAVRRYRRADFAARYAAIVLGEGPAFEIDMAARDRALEGLRARVRAALGASSPSR